MQIISDLLTPLAGKQVWILQAFLVIFFTLLCSYVVRRGLKKLYEKCQLTPIIWDDVLVAAAQGPARLLIWLVGLTYAVDIVYAATQAPIFQAVAPLRHIGVIGIVTWFAMRLVRRLRRIWMARGEAAGKPIDLTTADAVGKLLQASILITATLVGLEAMGFSISGILAFGGIGGIAIGFAAKDMLANFFGGLMLYLDRPFAVGDWVRSSDREIEGTVEEIGWRQTRIRAFDMRPIYIPNGMFSTMTIVNPSRMTHRQIYETIGIRYADAGKMAGIVAAVKAMLDTHPEIDQGQITLANFNTFAPSSLDFFIYAYTRTTKWARYHEVKQDVLLQVMRIIDEHGAEIAFPTSTLHLADAVKVRGEG